MNGERPPPFLPTLTEVVDLTPIAPVVSPRDRAPTSVGEASNQPPDADSGDEAQFSVPEDAVIDLSVSADASGLAPEDYSNSDQWPEIAEARGKPAPQEDDELTQRVLARVERQIELMLEVRVRESLTPVLTRLTDALMREARAELTSVLTDIVARAVAQEMSRHREP